MKTSSPKSSARRRISAAAVIAALGGATLVAPTAQADRVTVTDGATAGPQRPRVPSTIHSLGWTGSPNARDLGGYRTSDGGRVKYGLLFRSGDLDELTASDLAGLDNLGLRSILDLRAPEEIAKHPDPDVPGASNLTFPLIPGGNAIINVASTATTIEEAREDIDSIGGPVGGYFLFQHELADSHAIRQLRAAFRALLAADGAPVLIHCTAGQDRTGLMAYVILRVLGVRADDAVADYLASNHYNHDDMTDLVAELEQLGYSEKLSEEGAFLQRDFLEATLDLLEQVYGSFPAFVSQGLGLTSRDIEMLRRNYVGR